MVIEANKELTDKEKEFILEDYEAGSFFIIGETRFKILKKTKKRITIEPISLTSTLIGKIKDDLREKKEVFRTVENDKITEKTS